MATHASILAWRIPWTEKPDGLQSMGSQKSDINEHTHRGTSLAIQWLRLCTPNAQGPGSIPRQGTRSHMPQLRVCILQLKIPQLAIKTVAHITLKILHEATNT